MEPTTNKPQKKTKSPISISSSSEDRHNYHKSKKSPKDSKELESETERAKAMKYLTISKIREALKPYIDAEEENLKNEKIFTKLKLSIDQFREGIIGRNVLYESPFGGKIITLYADDTASGRPHDIVENYIRSILPIYANTHSDNSYFPVSMHVIYKDAIRYLKSIFYAPKNYVLLGIGTGCTGAIFRFQEILMQKYGSTFKNPDNPPLCFITQYEHHSNILSWQKYGFNVIPIEHTHRHHWEKGIKDLSEKLEKNTKSPLIVISTSAASNVTSQKTPLKMISDTFRRFKKKYPETPIVWAVDLAAYVPHARLDMNALKIDAVFISPHKLTGGPGSCGILIFNTEHYAQSLPPSHPAGGTVNLVVGYQSNEVIYAKDILERESDGTPGILQLIRAKEAFALQDKIGLDYIEKRENELKEWMFNDVNKMNENWEKKESGCKILILGTQNIEERSSVFSIVLYDKTGKIYHYHLIQRTLNDIFGVQVRSGCNCAGPFGMKLLEKPFKIKENYSILMEEIKKGHSVHKPGWVRFNVHYSFTDEDMKYLIYALKFVTENGSEISKNYYEEKEGEYRISQQNHLNESLSSITVGTVKRMEIKEIKESKRNEYLKKTKTAVKNFCTVNNYC